MNYILIYINYDIPAKRCNVTSRINIFKPKKANVDCALNYNKHILLAVQQLTHWCCIVNLGLYLGKLAEYVPTEIMS